MPLSRAGAIRAGRAFVEAFLDTSELEKQLGQIQGRLNRFAQQVGAVGGTLAGAGAAILAPMAAAVKTFSAAGDQLQKMSIRTGESVENLSALKFAAGRSGVEFEDLIGSAEELNIRLGEAAREGTGPLAETFKKLGLDARQLIALPLPERLKVIGDALNGLGDNAARGFAADEIFGGDAFKILPLLTEGSQGIDALVAKARELGLVMSGEAADSAAEMTDALSDMELSFKAIFKTLGRELLPIALDFTKWIQSTLPEIREWLDDNQTLVEALAKLGAGLVAVGGTLLGIAAAAKAAAVATGVLRTAVLALSGSFGALRAALASTGVGALLVGGGFLLSWLLESKDAAAELNAELDRTAGKVKAADAAAAGSQPPVQPDVQNDIQNAKEIEQLVNREAQLRDELRERRDREIALTQRRTSAREDFAQIADQIAAGQAPRDPDERNRLFERQEAARLQAVEASADIEKVREEQEKLRDAIAETEAARSEKIEERLRGLQEEASLARLDPIERALQPLRDLAASEAELAVARQRLKEINEAEAAAAEKRQAAQDAESVGRIIQDLANQVSDLQLDPADRPAAQLQRRLEELGATPEQIEKALELQKQAQDLDDSPARDFAAQGGTFSSLSSLIFATGKDDTQKRIAEASRETADNTKKLVKDGSPQTVVP